MTLPRDLFKDITAALIPHVKEDEREVLFNSALYGEKILEKVEWSGSAAVFANREVKRLDEFGYCANGTDHTLARILTELADRVGEDGRETVNALLARLHDHLEAEKKVASNPAPYPPTTAQNVPPERPETVQTWRLALQVVAVLLLIVGGAWLISTPGFEPLLALLGGVATMLTTMSQPVPRQLNEPGRRWWWFWQRDNDTELLNRLQKSWIEGFLYRALRDMRQFVIRTPLKTDAVLRHKDVAQYDLRSTADIWAIYRVFDEHLLILGDPGAGKTILMLQLAEMLLKEARASLQKRRTDPNVRLPRLPVVFNLASWARTQKPLHDWLIDEFKTFYRVGPKVAHKWLTNRRLILMLDGLDEVKEEVRSACVEAINAFRTDLDFAGIRMVVCSRIKDYEALRVRLNLDGAITLQPLEVAAVDQYLADQGENTAGLVKAITADPTLREMSLTPFLLNTMVYTYKGASAALIGVYPDPAERREKLFERYVERCLDDLPSPYGYARTLKYLRWLAKKMLAYTQTVFRPTDIEPYWLDEGQLKGRLANFLFPMVGGARRYLKKGIGAFVQRILVRLWLIRRDYLPLQITRFLRTMQDRQIMRPLSGGHVFLHRYLLESLAGRDEIMILIGQLENENTRAHAEQALIRIGEPAIRPLLAEVIDSQGRIHAGALGCLLNMGEKSVEPLTAKFRERADALQIGPLLRSTHPASKAILHELGQLTLRPTLNALADERFRPWAAEWLLEIGDPAHKTVVEMYGEHDSERRAELGRALADNDPRPGVGLRPDGLPDIVWCDVPGGPFQMGREMGFTSEKPVHTMIVAHFQIAKYPVTYRQFHRCAGRLP
jgi:hypothetical protein